MYINFLALRAVKTAARFMLYINSFQIEKKYDTNSMYNEKIEKNGFFFYQTHFVTHIFA